MRGGDASWSFALDHLQRIQHILDGYLQAGRARGMLLLDRTGQFLTAAGSVTDLDAASFASLAAADFAASQRLAELLGEEEFVSLFHQGELGSMLLTDVGGRAILATLFDARTTLGMLRLKSRSVVPRLLRVLEEAAERGRGEGPERVLGSGWADEAAGEIDRLFVE